MLLEKLLASFPEVASRGCLQVQIRGISYDSRHVKPGDLFVALRGEKTDGAFFLEEAIARGAAALASDRPLAVEPGPPILKVPDARRFLAEASRALFEDPASKMRLVAITGTNGKTTTSYLVDAIFRQAGLRSCLIGTLGMRIGDQPFPSDHTTPESSDLTVFLRQALQSGCTHGALEVSSHALVLKRVFGSRFAAGVFSNLTPEHLDFHHDMESYYQAKRLLFTPAGENRIETAVINTDDPYGQRLAKEAAAPVLSYGINPEAAIHPLASRLGVDGTDLRIQTPGGKLDVHTQLVGRTNIYNIMAATGACLSLGMQSDAIRKGIESMGGVPGRLEVVRGGQDYTVIVDYAHTPDALEKLLETVRQLTGGRIITVFGCGGDRDRKKRPVMGEIAARLSDTVIATSDNPRSEDPGQILAQIEPGLRRGPAPYRLLVERREAIRAALSSARKGDVVLLAGKGHENYQIIGTEVIRFDDREIARDLIQQLLNAQGD